MDQKCLVNITNYINNNTEFRVTGKLIEIEATKRSEGSQHIELSFKSIMGTIEVKLSQHRNFLQFELTQAYNTSFKYIVALYELIQSESFKKLVIDEWNRGIIREKAKARRIEFIV